MTKKVTDNWQKLQKIKLQLTFVVRFTDNWQKPLAIVIRLRFIEHNFLFLKYYYINVFSLISHAV